MAALYALRWARAYLLLSCLYVALPSAFAQDAPASKHPHVQAIRALLSTPEESIDFAQAKVAIDQLVDPGIDTAATLAQLDAMAAEIRHRLPFGASSSQRADALRRHLYEPGLWNRGQTFSYDFSDPEGTRIGNKLLATYLRTRKGNCVSMPFLYIALAQKLGLTVSAATAPLHVFVKLRDDSGAWHNIETTSGGFPRRERLYLEDHPMPREALANGLYMRPLTKRETVLVMTQTLLEHHADARRPQANLIIALADVVLEHDPKNAEAMVHKGHGYYLLLKQRYLEKYGSAAAIPEGERGAYRALQKENRRWFTKAEALGWREPTKEDTARYISTVRRVEAAVR